MICLLRKHFFVFDVTRAVWIWDEFMYYITNLNLMQNIPVNCAVLEKIYIFLRFNESLRNFQTIIWPTDTLWLLNLSDEKM